MEIEIWHPQENVNETKQQQGLQFMGTLCIKEEAAKALCLTSIFQNPDFICRKRAKKASLLQLSLSSYTEFWGFIGSSIWQEDPTSL